MNKYIIKPLVFIGDFLFINLAFAAIFWLRFQSGYLTASYDPDKLLADYLAPMLLIWVYWFILFIFSGLYRNWTKESRVDQAIVVIKTITIGILFISLITSWNQIMELVKTGDWHVLFTRTKATIILQYWISLSFFTVFDRILLDTIFKRLMASGIGANSVLIIGANESGKELRASLDKYPTLGHRVVGYVDDDGRKKGTEFDSLPVLGTYSDLPNLCQKLKISSVIISKVSNSHNEISKITRYCTPLNITIHMEPDLMDVIKGHLKTHQLYGFPLLVLLPEHLPEWEASIKRFMDITISVLVLVLGFPFWLMLALIIKFDSKGPLIFKQERIGQYGAPFIINKFRTMIANAEKNSGPVWAGSRDPRITRVGRIMRKTRLDEIPQFINVLKGEMSLVGPRPERAFFIEQLKEEIPVYVRRMKMKPGITGWAQVKHHYDQSIDDVRKKVIFDLYYFENMSLRLDIKILILSIWVVFTGKGAH